jgi:hypothetical protein
MTNSTHLRLAVAALALLSGISVAAAADNAISKSTHGRDYAAASAALGTLR